LAHRPAASQTRSAASLIPGCAPAPATRVVSLGELRETWSRCERIGPWRLGKDLTGSGLFGQSSSSHTEAVASRRQGPAAMVTGVEPASRCSRIAEVDASRNRTWLISFDGSLETPWIAWPDNGKKIFFPQADSLVRFLVEGGLTAEAVRTALQSVKAGGEAMVTLADRS
jgi:hypothetical protein